MKITCRKSFISCATAALMLPASYVCAQDGHDVVRSGDFADDVFVMGDHVLVEAQIAQDLFVTGGHVEIDSSVKGDVFAAGGELDIGGHVTGTLLAAGGRIKLTGNIREGIVVIGGNVDADADIDGDVLLTAGNADVIGNVKGDLRGSAGKFEIHNLVEGNVLLGGGKVELRDSSHILGKATIGAGKLYVGGHIERGLKAGAREIVIAGVIDGNVKLVANQITLLPSARIKGDLVYRSPHEIKLADGAQISGDVTFIQSEGMRRGMGGLFAVAGGTHLIIVIGLMIVAGVFVLVAPPLLPSIESRIKARKWKALGLGLGFLIVGPVIMTLLTITAVGFPLALIMSALYFLIIVTGLFGASYALGQWVMGCFKLDFRTSAWKQVAAAACGLVILGLIVVAPVGGAILLMLAIAFGVGALLSEGFVLCRGKSALVKV